MLARLNDLARILGVQLQADNYPRTRAEVPPAPTQDPAPSGNEEATQQSSINPSEIYYENRTLHIYYGPTQRVSPVYGSHDYLS
jgi:hypothetical protein